jgi:hypothetical protein
MAFWQHLNKHFSIFAVKKPFIDVGMHKKFKLLASTKPNEQSPRQRSQFLQSSTPFQVS